MKIRTNNQPRPILSAFELTADELKEFDYLESDDMLQAFRYRGSVYDLGEFVRITPRANWRGGFDHPADEGSPLLAWDGIQTESFFSAIVVRYSQDGESVVVGLATS